MDEQVLLDLGLSKNEVSVYLKLAEMGPSTAVQISHEAKIHRPNVYDALDKLVKKGLIAYFVRETVKYFEVVDPEQLLTISKIKEMDIQNAISEIKILQLAAKPPSSIAVFEGIAGARRIMTDIINNTKEFYVLGVPRDYAKTIGEGWVREWHEQRVKKKVWFHHIINQDYYPHRIKFLRSMQYTTIKFLPKEYNSPNLLFIYDKGVVMTFMQPMASIRILSEDAVKSFKQYYNMLLKLALDKAPQE